MTIRPQGIRANRWRIASPVPPDLRQHLSHLHPVMLQLLYNRHLTDEAQIQAFLDGRYLRADDPFLLPDMEQAVARIEAAVDHDERIIVYGDFDADGVTATVLLVQALRGLGLSREQVQPYIPDRVDEGYGLNKEALTFLKEEKGAGLVISVDCGIRSVPEVQHAREIGLDMIVTDHHSLGPQLPPAVALINPKREGPYPERMLAGVGIAYKLAQALHEAMPERVRFSESQLLDLVALGTVADLAPLQGENRFLVMSGLEVLNRGERPGVFALTRISGLTPGQVTAENIGFGLGPRINAAGRLSHAYDAARLLATNNMLMAERYAHALNELNKQRRSLTRRLSKQAETMVTEEDPILIASDPEFASGVVGLVASRLAEKHYRPAIVMEQGDKESRASCRSIPGFHITNVLDEVGHLLEKHGGHAQAAGFTIRNENLERFKAEVTEIAAQKLAEVELMPTLDVDVELRLDQIDWALQGQLAQLEPTGEANRSPVFVSHGVNVMRHRAVGQDGAHLQLEVNDGPHGFKCIAFRQGEWASSLPRRVDIVYTIGVNEWNGNRSLQLIVQDIRPASDNE